MRVFTAVVCTALLLGADPEPSPPPTPNAYAILARARDVFHSHVSPPYVVYTLERRQQGDQRVPSFVYLLRIWCRTRDSAALMRTLDRRTGRAKGELNFVRPALNGPVDPGPPTADIFQIDSARAPLSSGVELDYRAEVVDLEDGAYPLKVDALRDTDRNRLSELWVDAASFEVRHAVVGDRLFVSGEKPQPIQMDMFFERHDGVTVLSRIQTESTYALGSPRRTEWFRRVDEFVFGDAVFTSPPPDWYFEAKSYREHAGEGPAH